MAAKKRNSSKKKRTKTGPVRAPVPHTLPGIELRDPRGLAPHPRNSNTHPKKQIQKLASAIRRFGFTSPVVIDREGRILAGHARVMAAIEVGLEQIPTVVMAEWDEKKARAYMIADNRLARDSELDETMLREELNFLGVEEIGDFLGFDDAELRAVFTEGFGDDQDEQDAPEEAATTYEIAIECRDEQQQRELHDELVGRGLAVRIMTI